MNRFLIVYILSCGLTKMSFVKRPAMKELNSHFLIEMVPDPTQRFSEQQALAQKDVLRQMQDAGKDMFQPNPAVEMAGATKCRQLYNRTVSVTDMSAAMDKYGLVMRVNLKGNDSTTTAMATATDLRNNNVITSPSGSFSLVTSGNYIRGIDLV